MTVSLVSNTQQMAALQCQTSIGKMALLFVEFLLLLYYDFY